MSNILYQNMRPGVFANYVVTKEYSGLKDRSVGIIANTNQTQASVKKVSDLNSAKLIFGSNYQQIYAYKMIEAVLSNSSCEVYVANTGGSSLDLYKSAIKVLALKCDVYCVISDNNSLEILQYMASVFSDNKMCNGAKIGVANCLVGLNPIQLANSINSHRICCSYPRVIKNADLQDVSHAILAGMINRSDETSNLFFEQVSGDYTVNNQDGLSEQDINLYLKNGITIFEQGLGKVEVIRCVTTKTIGLNEQKDYTYRNISLVRISDAVILSLENVLKDAFKNIQSNKITISSIQSLVECELMELKDKGLISDYERPTVSLDSTDSSICVVNVTFMVRQGVSQIYLTADVRV